MQRHASLLLAVWALALAATSFHGAHANTLASVTATRPKPIVLTTAKPPSPTGSKPKPSGGSDPSSGGGSSTTSPSAPTSGGGSSTVNTDNVLFLPCTTVDVALVMNPSDYDVQQCMAFSSYNFGSGFLPTPLQASLLCDTGCWSLINRLEMTPIPYCSVVLGGRAVNYIDALYTVFADCVADPTKSQTTTTSAPSTSTTSSPSSGSTAVGSAVFSLTASAVMVTTMML